MAAYIAKRLLWGIPTLLGAVTIIFFIMRVLPGDVAQCILGMEGNIIDPAQLEAVRDELGLNRPLYEQYFSWLWQLLQVDLGISLWSGEPVWKEICIRLPYTLSLIALSMTISILLAIPIGVVSALKQDTWVDYGLRSFAITGLSIPGFWFGLLILLFTVSVFRWSPPLQYAPIYEHPLIGIQQLLLPAIALGYRSTGTASRMMRSAMLEVMQEDYIRTARAKGLRERAVIYIHALRNAILPVITLFGLEIVVLFSAAVIIEQIFNIPGIGRLLVDAINNRDVVTVQGVVAFTVGFVLVINLLVDVIYAWIDPRVRFR